MRANRVAELFLCAAVSLTAQHQHVAPSRQKPAMILPGLGEHHHPIATRNAEAQKFFNQGLTLMYGFNHERR